MKIVVDSDSCPRLAREIVVRASQRTGIRAFFVANRVIPGIQGGTVFMEVCAPEPGAADDRIVELAEPGDIAVTRDIPLAHRLIEASVLTVDDRGRVFTKENIRNLLSIRNFVVGLAENGLGPERIAHYTRKEVKIFADSFDRLLAHRMGEIKR
ncbi:UPF0178 protein [Spirochaetia bacterium]|nr:UPF0178 protein [Spirochaetia bacterium]